jgi:hypothetical protein
MRIIDNASPQRRQDFKGEYKVMTTKRWTACVFLFALSACIAATSANAEQFTFSMTGAGSVPGTITGVIDLSFVGPGGSGTGAASSVTLTSFPGGFGSFSGGNVVTSWADQIANSFTVTAGAITSDNFYALTGGDDAANEFCLNGVGSFGEYTCGGGLNFAQTNVTNYNYNFGGVSGVSFAPVSSTPEPASLSLLLTGIAAGGAMLKRRGFSLLPSADSLA